MRLDGSGRRRFQFRIRVGDEHVGGTYDGWQEAHDARSGLETETSTGGSDSAGPSATEVCTWTIDRYAREAWWQTVLLDTDLLTQVDYERGLKDLLPRPAGRHDVDCRQPSVASRLHAFARTRRVLRLVLRTVLGGV